MTASSPSAPRTVSAAGVDHQRRLWLLRISLRIGLGESARFLRAHGTWLRAMLLRRRFTPTELLHELAPSFADPGARIEGIHVYTFNELERTERWRRELVEHFTPSR